MDIYKIKPFLLYTYIIPFSFWAFDVITTLYAISFLEVAGELNPLGWPLGAWGALVFYIPALIFTYMLMFRIRSKHSIWAAVLITLLALGLGVMNLLAGLHNIGIAELFT